MTNDKKIWVVQGSTGEYSDHCEWLVCAFSEENDAKTFVEELSGLGRLAFEKRMEIRKTCIDWETTIEGKALLARDPNASIDYTGIMYTAFEVSLADTVPDHTALSQTIKSQNQTAQAMIKKLKAQEELLKQARDALVKSRSRARDLREKDGIAFETVTAINKALGETK